MCFFYLLFLSCFVCGFGRTKKDLDKMREIVFHLSRLCLRCCLQHEVTISFSFIICFRVGHGSLGWYQNSTSRHSVLRERKGLCVWRVYAKTALANGEGWTEPQRREPCAHPVPGTSCQCLLSALLPPLIPNGCASLLEQCDTWVTTKCTWTYIPALF